MMPRMKELTYERRLVRGHLRKGETEQITWKYLKCTRDGQPPVMTACLL